jgi:hypothetical protein
VYFKKKGGMCVFSLPRAKICCLTCSKAVTVTKECSWRRHYGSLYKDNFGVLEGRLKEDKSKNLKCDLQQRQNVFTVATKTNEAALQASFVISQITAKKSKPFTESEYARECIMKAAEIFCLQKTDF